MITLYVLRYHNRSVDNIIRWCGFHGIKVEVHDNIDSINLNGFGIFITNDLYPEPQLIIDLISGKHYLYSDISFTGEKLLPTFCIVSDKIEDVKTVLSQHPNDKMYYSPGIALRNPVNELNMRAGTDITSQVRCDLLWKMVHDYWYVLNSHDVVIKYYCHLWINACQILNISIGKEYDAIVGHLKGQSFFTSSIQRERIEIESIRDTLKYLKEGIDLYQCMTGNIKGYIAKSKVSKHLISKHILSVNGKVVLEPSDEEDEFDASVTVVSFYYDLGYSEKPSEDYMKSIENFAKIPHPLIFFGDSKTCEYVKELRSEYTKYTLVIYHPLLMWELVHKYTEDFDDMNTSKGFKGSKRYSILTCCKFFAIEKAIRENPFLTEKFAWLDCGAFRHTHIIRNELIGKALFKRCEFDKDKIMIPSSSLYPGTSEDEFKEGVENVIAIAMIGTEVPWKKFISKFKKFVYKKFDIGVFFTEQVMMSRLIGIYPDLVEPRLYGFNASQFENMLCIS